MTPARAKYLEQFQPKRIKVRQMLESGCTHAEIARALKISRQRVFQLAQAVK